jgi:hypothetical protein
MRYTLSLIAAAALLSGCATSNPVPASEFEMVRSSIEEAQEVEASRYAGDELLQAERKLQQARTANEAGDEVLAKRLLEQAQIHAELAEVTAMTSKASASLTEINVALRTLERELNQ